MNTPVLAVGNPGNTFRRGRRGASPVLVVGAIVAIALIGGGTWFFVSQQSDSVDEDLLVKSIVRGKFQSVVLDQGEVESSENVEFRCEVKGGTSIIWIIDEGKIVKEGDELVRLDSSALEQELQAQQVSVNNHESLVIQSKAIYETAVKSLEEYQEGTFKQEEQTIQNEIFEAEENLRKAQQYLNYSERLAARGFVTALQLEADRFAVEKARNALELGIRKLSVLRNQTQLKMLITLQGDIDKAKGTWDNDVESLKVEETKLEEIREQIDKCVIIVPPGVEGQVVHANKFSSRGGSAEWVAEEGATVREKQVIIRLPNPNKMQVKATVNESRVTSVVPNMPVSIQLDALDKDQTLAGKVLKVNQYPEPSGFGGGGVKQYGVFIQILDPPPTIRSGMNASVSILTEQRDDVLQIPLPAIYEHNGRTFCLVVNDNGFETRHIKIGPNNETMAVIESGQGYDTVRAGEEVVMNPRKFSERFQFPELPEPPQVEVASDGPPLPTPSASGGPPAARDGGAGGPPSSGGAFAGGPPSAAELVTRTLEQADLDKDGKISTEELQNVDERARDRLAEADRNQDGFIDRGELTSAMQQVAKMIQERMRGGGAFPGGGNP